MGEVWLSCNHKLADDKPIPEACWFRDGGSFDEYSWGVLCDNCRLRYEIPPPPWIVEGNKVSVDTQEEELNKFYALVGELITFEGVPYYIINAWEYDELKEGFDALKRAGE